MTVPTEDLRQARTIYRELEDLGYDRAFSFEAKHDPFVPLAVAGEHTSRIELGTAVAIAFARTPMTLANVAWDLQTVTGGRFVLGLGSQIRPHVEQRFSMPWDPPVGRMRELVLGIRAIWRAWETGEPLAFEGEHYTHTRMIPAFDPGPNPFGAPRILTAGVGPQMTEVAGEVADGLIVHPFNNIPFLEQAALPAVRRGLAKAGRERGDFTLQLNAMVITGESEQAMAAATQSVKGLLGFYASTPAYRPPMEAIGRGDLQPELNRLSKAGKWQELGEHIDDDFLEAFTTRGAPEEIAGKLLAKYGQHADRLAIYAPYAAPDGMWKKIVEGLKRER